MSTFSKLRVGPKRASAGSVKLLAKLTIAPGASAATGFILPKGASVLQIIHDGGQTGGTTPTISIGTSGTPGLFLLNSDANTASTTQSASLTALAADTELYAGDGTGTAGTGNVTAFVEYYIQDSRDGVNN